MQIISGMPEHLNNKLLTEPEICGKPISASSVFYAIISVPVFLFPENTKCEQIGNGIRSGRCVHANKITE